MTNFLLHLAGLLAAGLVWLLFLLNVAGLPADVMDLWREMKK